MTHTYKFPRPVLTADMAVFARRKNHNGGIDGWMVLLIERKKAPHEGCLALPGGHFDVERDESIAHTATRELEEETGIGVLLPDPAQNLVGVWSKKDRDPRGRYVSTVYFAVLPEPMELKAGDDAADARWEDMESVLNGWVGKRCLAFDHREMILEAWNHVRKNVLWTDSAKGAA